MKLKATKSRPPLSGLFVNTLPPLPPSVCTGLVSSCPRLLMGILGLDVASCAHLASTCRTSDSIPACPPGKASGSASLSSASFSTSAVHAIVTATEVFFSEMFSLLLCL